MPARLNGDDASTVAILLCSVCNHVPDAPWLAISCCFQVLDLRERRLDEEEAAAEVQKVLDTLKREREMQLKKQKTIEASLLAINNESLEYQKEKQSKLNTLGIALNVRLHQVQYLMADGRLPDDVSRGLLFNQHTQERLQVRISELDEDRAGLRARRAELHEEHQQLNLKKKAKQHHLASLQAKCRDVQLLRFGQVRQCSVTIAHASLAGSAACFRVNVQRVMLG